MAKTKTRTMVEEVELVCELESEGGQVAETTRNRVLREGRAIRRLQKLQKAEQKAATERGEDPQPWKDWCAAQKVTRSHFPVYEVCNRYVRISTYPGAFEAGMSINEAHKMATQWKNNGGAPPITSKVAIKTRIPNQLGAAVGRATTKLDKYNEVEDWAVAAVEEKWTEDDFAGLDDALQECKQSLAFSIRKLKAAKEGIDCG